MSEPTQEPKEPRIQAPYARMAIDYILVILIAGTAACILAFFAALVYWAWTA